ncbi:hypothetical protein GCL60_16305 [Silvanigrella paludirubra]|uniref:HTH cro/C1-type domain-containing protein n=1 Tax=Silvanigrella paludirubra TaxID=2499159 RepID=A0A6N6VQ59_9BACT|nr:helix-turn-helix transcriptional regulator [Silvanigrella paludirubra]KAB8035790.1 hypothetical protein GCL60_16305 [Silvanigrella paludirubra]
MEMTNLVKLIRKNANLTQEKAANILDVEKRTWERWEEGSRTPSIQNMELFCIKTNQNFDDYKDEFETYLEINKLFSEHKFDKEKILLITDIAEKITKDILKESEKRRANAEFCKLEHFKNEILITRWGDRAIYAGTKIDANIRTWYNFLLEDFLIKKQVINYLIECDSKNLSLNYNISEENAS